MSRQKKDIKTLECVLTDSEIISYSKELGDRISERNRLEATKKSYMTQIGAEIASVNARISTLAEKVYSGREYREIECRITYDFETKTKSWWRIDTGEHIKDDIIPESELQEELGV